MVDRLRERLKQDPQLIFYSVLGFLVLSIVFVLFIDVADPAGLRSRWIASGSQTTFDINFFLWFHWFGTPVENPLQWILLSLSIAIFLMGAGAALQRGDSPAFEFCLLISLGMSLMLVEDIADPRHALRVQVEAMVGSAGYGITGTLVELAYFAVLAAIMLLALILHRSAYWALPRVRRFLLTGYAFYALAVGSSWLGSAFSGRSDDASDLYSLAGQWICDLLFLNGGETEEAYHQMDALIQQLSGDPLAFFFMDRVYEESLELLGASALLVAAIALFVATTDADNVSHQAADSSSE